MTRGPEANRANRRGAEAAARIGTILRISTQLFLRKGYAATSLNDVVARAGGSKATVRKYFKNKAGLFSAVIADVSSKFVESARFKDIDADPETGLRRFGEIVLGFYLEADSLVCYRGVVAEGQSSPAMAQSFYEQGHRLVQAALAERLGEWRRSGQIASTNHLDDADLFLHLIRAGAYEQRLIGIRKPPTDDEVSRRVESAVRVFLYGVAGTSMAMR